MKNLVIAAWMLSSLTTLSAENTDIHYPSGYKEWKHIKTMIIKPEHPLAESFQGIHHIYANDVAYSGYQSGTFENGSKIVLDYLNYADVNETISETSRIYVAIMHKDEKKFLKTGGWGYEAFKGDAKDKMVTNVQNMCVKCHTSQAKNDYIFSKIRK